MAILWLGLLVAMVPTFYFNWTAGEETASRQSSNARCFYDIGTAAKAFSDRGCENAKAEHRDWMLDRGLEPEPDPPCLGLDLNETRAFGSTIISFLLAAFSFPSRAIKLVGSWSGAAKRHVRERCSNPALSVIRNSMGKERISAAFLATQVYLVAKMYADLLSSELSDVSYQEHSTSPFFSGGPRKILFIANWVRLGLLDNSFCFLGYNSTSTASRFPSKKHQRIRTRMAVWPNPPSISSFRPCNSGDHIHAAQDQKGKSSPE